MSAREYRMARFKNEDQFEAWVISILRANGWRITSMKDSRRQRWDTHTGIPDIIAVHREKRCILFAELKMPGRKPSKVQAAWIGDLRAVERELYDENIHIAVWRPENEDEIIEFAGGRQPLV